MWTGYTNICYKDAETITRKIRISLTFFVCVLSVSINPETALVSGECRAMLLWPAGDTTTRFSSLIKYIFISCYHHPQLPQQRTPIISRKQNISRVESYHQAPAPCSPFSYNLNVVHISSAPQHLSLTCFVLTHSKLRICP